jgi:hypothetical protein
MKKFNCILIIVLSVFNILFLNAQNNKPIEKLSFINKKIKYQIVLSAIEHGHGKMLKGLNYRIDMELSDKELEILSKLKSEQWINLLKNTKTDWNTNLILHFLYEKSALPYFEKGQKKYWYLLNYKKEDVKFWKEKFKDSIPKWHVYD